MFEPRSLTGTAMRFLPYRLRSRIEARQHDAVCRPVLDTPPLQPADDGVVLFSMIGTAVLLPYLVAVKSLWGELRRGRVVLLDDGTLTPGDRALLAHHCGEPEILPLRAIDAAGFPRGNCWERLLAILDRAGPGAGSYVVQLDSDTVTVGPVPEVAQAVEAQRSFTLAGEPEWTVGAVPVSELCAIPRPPHAASSHIQSRMEAALPQVGTPHGWFYIRGCAGFAGFAPGAASRAQATAMVEALSGVLGRDALDAWGSEQVASNFLVANAPDPLVLPTHRYINHAGVPLGTQVAFAHFIGSWRHLGSAYADATRRAIAAMQRR